MSGVKGKSGRKKGSKNKITKDLKAAIMGAFSDAGGQKYLARIADDNPKVFCTLLGKILPSELTGKDGGPIQFSKIERVIIDGATDRNTAGV